VESLKKASRRI